MQLQELYIKDYRILKDFEIDFEDNLSVIIGENGSGKSTFYEILVQIYSSLYRWERVANVDFRIKYLHSYSKIVEETSTWQSSESHLMEIEIEGTTTTRNYFDIKINGKPYSKVKIEEEFETISNILPNIMIYYSGFSERMKFWGNLQEKEAIEAFKPDERERLYFNEYSTLINKGITYYDNKKHFNLIALAFLALEYSQQADDFLENSLYLQKVHQNFTYFDIIKPDFLKGRSKENFWGATGQLLRFLTLLKEYGTILPNEEANRIKFSFDLEDWYMIRGEYVEEKFIFYLLKMLQSLGMLDEVIVYVHSLENEGEIRLTDLSDGQQQLLITNSFFELFANEDLLVLMDEPDVFLHPSWQGKFIKHLATHDNSHYIISTHSPFLLSHYEGEEVHLFGQGKVVNTARFYGREIEEILNYMGGDINFRPPEIVSKIDKLFRLIASAGDLDKLTEAEKYYKNLVEEIGGGEDDKGLQKAISEINFKKFELGKDQ